VLVSERLSDAVGLLKGSRASVDNRIGRRQASDSECAAEELPPHPQTESHADASGGPEGAAQQETTATGRRRRRDAGAAREKARSWSEDEERLFLEALELHGECSD
jgi:protein MYSM1